MKIKLNRGPAKNKRFEVPDGTRIWEVQKVDGPTFDMYGPSSMDYRYTPPKRGTYMRSNVRLKDGTVVFEWMGWID